MTNYPGDRADLNSINPDSYGDTPFDEDDNKDLVTAKVAKLPNCDFGDDRPALYDFKTLGGSWAYGCEDHYQAYRFYDSLGTGKGQRLVISE